MLRNAVRALLIALSLQFVLPLLFSGYQFHAGFLSALGLAVGFTVSYLIAGALIGLGLESFTAHSANSRKLMPLWLVLFWGMSSLLLVLTAHVLPSVLALNGWVAALGSGFVLLVAGMVTGRTSASSCSGNTCRMRNESPGARPELTPDEPAAPTTAGTPTSSGGKSSCGKGGCSCGKKGCSRCSAKPS